jgi:uncharacterized protein
MAKVTHFEIPADDMDRAKEFYSTVFGWDISTSPIPGGEYTSLVTTAVDPETYAPTEPGAINGGMFQREGRLTTPVITIDVPAIDDALAQVRTAGGDVVAERQEIPGMGAYAYFTDSEGNLMGLWETTT